MKDSVKIIYLVGQVILILGFFVLIGFLAWKVTPWVLLILFFMSIKFGLNEAEDEDVTE